MLSGCAVPNERMEGIEAKKEEKQRLKRQVKDWKADFEKANGRKATKADYDEDMHAWVEAHNRAHREITAHKGTRSWRSVEAPPAVQQQQQQLSEEEQKKVDKDLLTAAQNGDEEGVRDLLNRGANPNGYKNVR